MLAVTHAIAFGLRNRSHELAYSIAGYDGRIAALHAAALAGPGASATDRRRADPIAREALRDDGMAVVAVSALALNAQVLDDTVRARRLFAHAEQLSRRELQTQLWAISDAVARDDVSAALRHYDTALRVSPRLADLLFPVLAAASGDPAIMGPLVATLAKRPGWTQSFVDYAANAGGDAQATALLIRRLVQARVPVSQAAGATVISALVRKGRGEDGWALYAAIRPNVRRDISRDPRFEQRLDTPTMFDWVALDVKGGASVLAPNPGGGVFQFSAPGNNGGPVLQQTQLLAAGRYRLQGVMASLEGVEQAPPYWSLTCGDERELARVELPVGSSGQVTFAGEVTIPAGCPQQTLTLVIRPSSAVAGAAGEVVAAQLSPLRPVGR